MEKENRGLRRNENMKLPILQKPIKHPKCKTYLLSHHLDPIEYDCSYSTKISCDECKYNLNGGRKDPEAKCNKLFRKEN